MLRKIITYWVLVILLFSYGTAILAEESLTTEQVYLTDIPVVLSATRLQQPRRDAPASITIIDRRMIDASGAIDIADLLRFVPGFQVSMPNSNIFAVTSHGLSYQFPRKLQVLIDGRSVYRPLLSNVDWVNLGISLTDIERIEVVRGPSATVYGTNAFLGTINIITKQSFKESGYDIETLFGSRETKGSTITYANTSEERNYKITFEHRQDSGFKNTNDARQTNLLFMNGSYDFNALDSLDVQFSFSQGEFGAWGKKGNGFNQPREKQVTAYHGLIRWNKRFSAEEDFYLQIYRNYYEQEDDVDFGLLSEALGVDPDTLTTLLDGRPDQSISNGIYDGVAERSDIEIQHTYRFSDETRIVWGASYRDDRMKSQLQLDHNNYVVDTSKRLFANVEKIWNNRTVLNAGAMLEDNDIIDTKASPRIGLNYHINESYTIRTSSTKAYRSPSLYEQFNKWRIRLNDGSILKTFYDSTGTLEPEVIVAHEIGFLTSLPQQNISIDIKLYYEKITDIIVAPIDRSYIDSDFDLSLINASQGAKVWQNGGYAETKGWELELRYKPEKDSLLYLAYAYADIQGVLLEERNPDVEVVLSTQVPRNTVSGLYQYTFSDDWKVSASLYYLGRMTWNGAGDDLPSNKRVDLKVVKKHKGVGNEVEVSITVQNLLNDSYREFSNDNVFQRYTYLKIKYNL